MKLSIISIALTGFILTGCSNSEDNVNEVTEPPEPVPTPVPESPFSHIGLAGATVYGLEKTYSSVAAATDMGIYLYQEDNQWTLQTPENWDVKVIEALYDTQLLAYVKLTDDSPEADGFLVESRDEGKTWSEVETDFGVVFPEDPKEVMRDLHFNDQSGELFAVGIQVVVSSPDFGRSWAVVNGEWGAFATGYSIVTFDDINQSIWVGGQGAIENPILHKIDYTNLSSVNYSGDIEELLHPPSTIKSIRIFPDNDQVVYVAGEGGIANSQDYGDSWQPMLLNDNSRFYFDIVQDTQTGNLFTAGWDKNFSSPQPLLIEFSEDKGQTWNQRSYEDDTIQGGVWSMLVVTEEDSNKLYLGLQGGGVVTYSLD